MAFGSVAFAAGVAILSPMLLGALAFITAAAILSGHVLYWIACTVPPWRRWLWAMDARAENPARKGEVTVGG